MSTTAGYMPDHWALLAVIFSTHLSSSPLFSPSVSSAPKWRTPSTAISTRQTPTCSGILCSWWRLSPIPRPTTLTTQWWARSSMTARPTATASSAMCWWMCVWTTETLRGVLWCLVVWFRWEQSCTFWSDCSLMCFQGERYRDPVCWADGVLSLSECGVARHPQGSLLLLQQRQLWFQWFAL